MKRLILVLAFILAGCIGDQYIPPTVSPTTPNTIPEKTESIEDETIKIDETADVIESKQPELQKEVQSIKQGTEKIRNTSNEIKAESIVHDVEKEELKQKFIEVSEKVNELAEEQRKDKERRAFYLQCGVIGLFAITAVFFFWYGTKIPGTGYTVLGAMMCLVTVVTAVVWNYLEQNPLIVTGATVVFVITGTMMYLCNREKKANKDPLGFD